MIAVGAEPTSVLRWAYESYPRVAIVASFQAESSVIIDIASRIRPDINVLTLDTGRLPQETHDMIDRLPAQRLGRLQLEVQSRLDLGAEPLEAAVGERVLQARVLAVGPVAVVALHRDDLARQVDDLIRIDKRERQRGRRECFRLVVSAAEAAADQGVEAAQEAVVASHRHQREVVCVHVDAVVAFERDRGLELAREVLLAVQRFVLGL